MEPSFFSSIFEGIPTAQQYKISSFSPKEGMDAGTRKDRPVDELDVVLYLNSSWKTSKGTPGTTDK